MSVDASADIEIVHHELRTSLGTIAVAEVGEGPVLVLLHGGGPGASGVSNYHQNLPALSREFRVLMPDQPGFGGSYRPTEQDLHDRSITAITTQALLESLDLLGVEKFHLLGNSLGGAAALDIAIQTRDRVTSLVLMAPGGGWLPKGPTPTEGQKAMWKYYNAGGPSEKKMAAFIGVMVAEPKKLGPDVVRSRYEASLDESHIEFYHHYNAAFARRGGMDPLWRDVHRITAPTLLLWGRDDRTITLDGADIMIKQIPDVQLHVFGRCGHWVQLERQVEFDRLVADFVRSHA